MSNAFRLMLACGAMIALVPIAARSADKQSADGSYASEVPKAEVIQNKDGAALASDAEENSIPVAEELDFIRESNFRRRGEFDKTLKRVNSVDYYGTRTVGSEQFQLEVDEARPDSTRTLLKSTVESADAPIFEISKSAAGTSSHGSSRGLSIDDERALLESFEFDSPINVLEKDEHAFKPLGMQKLPGILAWKIEAGRAGAYHRVLYIDSHTGDVVKETILDAHGARILDVVRHDFRSVDGIRVPFAADYKGADGTVLANDRIERVRVKRRQS